MRQKAKVGLLIFFIALLALPGIQQYTHIVTSGPLYGYSPNAPDTTLTLFSWWNGSYQEHKGNYLNDTMGFRPDFIRLNNQVDYSLFGKTHSYKVIEGKDHDLFVDNYIDGYYGRDYMGYDSILVKMLQIKALSDTFARLGKTLIIVHTPSKEFFRPENIPDDRRSARRETTNLETYLRIGDSLHINQVDFNTWFCRMKDTSKELLYPKQGIHWSVYGSYLAADSMVKCLERLRSIHMPHPQWTNVIHSTKPRYSDNDIAQTLNLIAPIAKETFAYPEVSYPQDATMVKPRVIYIGDSFLLIWIKDGLMDNTNSDWQVWQWFSGVWDKDHNREDMPHHNLYPNEWISSIDNTDCIVLVYTSFNLPVIGNGFVEAAYKHYFPKGK
jgi:hypothetical protein